MKHGMIQRQIWFGMVALGAGLMLLGSGQALAVDQCVALGGALVNVPPVECQISAAVVKTGPFTLNETLHILSTGSITTGAGGITIEITAGDFVMDDGALIDGNNPGSCPRRGGPITVTVDHGNVDLKTGSIIRSNSCSGGDIVITTGNAGKIDIDGTVESVGSISGTGAVQAPGGGPITVKASCDLTISDTGVVSSRGKDPGADLVHLEGCTVEIFGLVESTGVGHGVPNSPHNHCDVTNHPDKPANATACVEVYSGTTILIDATGTHHGEINADTGGPGGSLGTSWIDIFAHGDIQINGAATPFAAHANGNAGTNDNGGVITVKSTSGSIGATGSALQADATGGGGAGGEIHIEAHANVNLSGSDVFARGDYFASGGFGNGGKIGTLALPTRAFTGSLSWTSGIGDVRPTGTGDAAHPVPLAKRGIIFFQDCLAPAGVTLGAAFPFNGNAATTPTTVADVCDASGPTLPAYATLPLATCTITTCGEKGTKRGMKFSDENGNHVKDPGDLGLPGWRINLYDSIGNLVTFVNTNAQGAYEFTVDPGTYTVCETQKVGWDQTFPDAAHPLVLPNGETLADCTGKGGGNGYTFTIGAGQVFEGNDFGNFNKTPGAQCPEDPSAVCTRTVLLSPPLLGVPNYLTLQEAYNDAGGGETICMFGNTIENVLLGDEKSLKITQCTLARITALDNSLPVVDITSTGALTIVSPDTVGGTVGWLVESNGHNLKSVRAKNASEAGIKITGNGNSVSMNSVSGSPVGILITGNSNTFKSGTISGNGIGVWIAAGTGNTVSVANVQSNTFNGIVVDSDFNTVSNVGRIDSNGQNGVLVNGSNNIIKNNSAGSDAKKGNVLDGFKIVGSGNTLDGNKASANGAIGFDILGSGNKLKNNQSNVDGPGGKKENGGFEYFFQDGSTLDLGSNKKDKLNFVGAGSPKRYAAGGYE